MTDVGGHHFSCELVVPHLALPRRDENAECCVLTRRIARVAFPRGEENHQGPHYMYTD